MINFLSPYINYVEGIRLEWCNLAISSALDYLKVEYQLTLEFDDLIEIYNTDEFIFSLLYGALYAACGMTIPQYEGLITSTTISMKEIVLAVYDGITNYLPKKRYSTQNLDEEWPDTQAEMAQKNPKQETDFISLYMNLHEEGFSIVEIEKMTMRTMLHFINKEGGDEEDGIM